MEERYCLKTVEIKDKWWKCSYKTECFVKVSKGEGKARQDINISHVSWQDSKYTILCWSCTDKQR